MSQLSWISTALYVAIKHSTNMIFYFNCHESVKIVHLKFIAYLYACRFNLAQKCKFIHSLKILTTTQIIATTYIKFHFKLLLYLSRMYFKGNSHLSWNINTWITCLHKILLKAYSLYVQFVSLTSSFNVTIYFALIVNLSITWNQLATWHEKITHSLLTRDTQWYIRQFIYLVNISSSSPLTYAVCFTRFII